MMTGDFRGPGAGYKTGWTSGDRLARRKRRKSVADVWLRPSSLRPA